MADNVAFTPGTGATGATDDIAGIHYPRVKLSLGADGTAVDAGAGAGAVGTDTQRVTLGSDDPAVVALQIIDDWDESDRAKVNPIVGQAGVTGGAGTSDAATQRVAIATNANAVAATLTAETTKVIGTVRMASGGVASGSFASGSVATGAIVDLGVAGDAASATGTISAKLRAIATALGVTALDLGSGTGGSRTLRFFKDTAQWVGGAGAVSSATQRVTLPSDDPAVAGLGGTADSAATAGSTGSINAKLRLMTTQLASLTRALDGDYETVAASQTDQMLGPTGATGDYLAGVLIIPATTSPGAVSIEDGTTNIPIFTGGTDSVTNLVPFFVPLGIVSTTGGWEITTGANVSVIGIGSFT